MTHTTALAEDADRQAILVVDDEPASVSLLRIALRSDYSVYTATDGDRALQVLAEHPEIALAIVDQRMPGMSGTDFIQRTIHPYPHLVRIILTGYTDIESLIEAINAGRVYRYLTKPWKTEELRMSVAQGLEVHRLAMENLRLHAELQAANARLRVENAFLRRDAKTHNRFAEIIGASPARQRMLDLVERVVPTDMTVLVLGETGTGKELTARAIHYNGPRADKPFVSENCGALAPELLTSELFGHRRGAFTDAAEDRKGLFEFVNGGTLFLDEIGDCPLDLQIRLLRVLDQGEIRRVGDNRSIKVDVRIMAATHHDLEQDVAAGRFRKDLYFRLSVFTIPIPALRERRDDIPLLAQHFLDRQIAATGKAVEGFSSAAIERLSAFDFPGNIRELENEVRRAHALADTGGSITPDLLSAKFTTTVDKPPLRDGGLRTAVERLEIQLICDALTRHDGNQTRAAADLDIGRRTLLDKVQRYGIVKARDAVATYLSSDTRDVDS